MANSYNTESGTAYSNVPSLKKLELKAANERAKLFHDEEMAKIANDVEIKKTEIAADTKRQSKHLGWLGHIFGGPEGASKYITATICLITLIGMICLSIKAYRCEDSIARIKDIWSIGSPIVTLSLGYLFGKN
jgi:hypothetical protein